MTLVAFRGLSCIVEADGAGSCCLTRSVRRYPNLARGPPAVSFRPSLSSE